MSLDFSVIYREKYSASSGKKTVKKWQQSITLTKISEILRVRSQLWSFTLTTKHHFSSQSLPVFARWPTLPVNPNHRCCFSSTKYLRYKIFSQSLHYFKVFNQSMDQSINQPTNRSINQSIHKDNTTKDNCHEKEEKWVSSHFLGRDFCFATNRSRLGVFHMGRWIPTEWQQICACDRSHFRVVEHSPTGQSDFAGHWLDQKDTYKQKQSWQLRKKTLKTEANKKTI